MSYVPLLVEVIITKAVSHAVDKIISKSSDYLEDPIRKEYRNLITDNIHTLDSYIEDDFIILKNNK